MDSNLFTYGTLVFPEVMRAVTGREFPHRKAVLPGFTSYLVRGQVFPGIVADDGGSTPGILYGEVDPASLERLDRFESELYQRQSILVTSENGETIEAQAFVVDPTHRHQLGTEPWDPAAFATRHMASYLKACRG